MREADILRVRSGLACEVKPAAAPDQKHVGSLKVGYLPRKSGGYEAVVELGELPPGIRPGMTGAVSIVLKEVRDAILVPKACVRQEGGKWLVRVWTDNAMQDREVVTGETDGRRIVIREGVQEGERVVVAAPAK